MANKVTTTNTTNKVVITPQSTKKLTIDSGNGNNLTVNQSTPNNIQITNNDVDTSLTSNNVSISSTGNNVSLSSTSTPVTVTQGTTSVVTVNTPGPQGPQGSGLTPGADIEVRNITASGNISASGNIITKNLISPTNENTRIQLLENNLVFYVNAESFQSLNLTPSVTIFNSANDPNKDFKIGTGTTDDFFVIDSGNDTLTIAGNITASGNISASGTIIADSLNILNGTIFGDNNGTDLIRISGSVEITGSNGILINAASSDISPLATLQLLSDGSGGIVKGGKRLTLKSHGGYDVQIKSTSNRTLFENNGATTYAILGDSTVGGTFFDTDVTASGNISASGTISGSIGHFNTIDGFVLGGVSTNNNILTSNGNGTFTAENSLTYNGTTFALQTQNIDMQASVGGFDLIGNITASGDISSSGDIEASGLILTSPNGTRYRITVENDGTLNIS